MCRRHSVGRDEESSHLAALLADPCVHSGLLFEGEQGIGTSMLAAHAADEAAVRGALVLSVTGARAEQSVPFAALHQSIFPVRRQIDDLPDRRRRALRDAVRPASRMAEGAPIGNVATIATGYCPTRPATATAVRDGRAATADK